MKTKEEYLSFNDEFLDVVFGMDNTEPKTFYELPIDQFNQPTGEVNRIRMTEARYQMAKLYEPNRYIFESAYEATKRAQS